MPRPTVARIDLDAISHNVTAIRALVGDRQICAAVKADAYGHGAPVVCHTLSAAGVDKFAVAMTEEAMDLRGAGIKKPIILLTAVPQEDIEVILANDITACIAEEGFARELSARALARGVQAPVHVNVDTGMHRIGLNHETAATGILRISRLAGLRIEGIFSHFACSDADDLTFSRLQVRRFRSVLAQLKRAGMQLPFIHMANSNGVLRVPEAYFDGVRPGLILYGLCSRPDVHYVADLRPVLSMRTRIAHCKRVPKGEKVGYGHTFTTWRDSVLATVPVGYHDGYIRQFSNVGEMLVRGKRVPVVGRVCMDQTLADVTDVPDVQLGDEVAIYGKQGEECISVEEMAARVDRIPYELTCAVGRRVRREFVLNGAVVVESPFRSVVPDAALGRILTTSAASSDEGLDQKPRRLGAA
ncbi:MAG: alanine racemase [Planctomycetota bacterium]